MMDGLKALILSREREPLIVLDVFKLFTESHQGFRQQTEMFSHFKLKAKLSKEQQVT